MSTLTTFRPGDVLRYTPAPRYPGQRDVWWCREGMARVRTRDDGSVYAIDTYWGSGGDEHVLTADELAAARLAFNTDDYDALAEYSRGASRMTWLTYAESDRAVITSQHQLQARYYIRKGAKPDLPTKIQNAREELAEAEREADSANRRVELRRRDLARLCAEVSR